MNKFDLGPNMADCPNYWVNFIADINKKPGLDVPIRRIQSELKKYNARYRFRGSYLCDYIEFESEKDYTFFVLRWA